MYELLVKLTRLPHHLVVLSPLRDQLPVIVCGLFAQLRRPQCNQDRLAKRPWIVRLHQETVETGSNPFMQRFDVSGDWKTSAGHGFQERIGRAIVCTWRDGYLGCAEKLCHLSPGQLWQQIDFVCDPVFLQPAVSLPLSFHRRANEPDLRACIQYQRHRPEENIVTNVGANPAGVDYT